jgi:hypothetical protein
LVLVCSTRKYQPLACMEIRKGTCTLVMLEKM